MQSRQMGYFSRIIGFAFQRSLLRTDVLAAVATALAPAAYFLVGQTMPENIALHISILVAALLAGVVLLRIVTAPYFIWKEDQAEIARLKALLGDPQERTRAILENDVVLARSFVRQFLVHHRVWHAIRDGHLSINQYDDLYGKMAQLLIEDPALQEVADDFNEAHDQALGWLTIYVKSQNIDPSRAGQVEAPPDIREAYVQAATALYERVSLKA